MDDLWKVVAAISGSIAAVLIALIVSITVYNVTVDKAAIEAGLHEQIVGTRKIWVNKNSKE